MNDDLLIAIGADLSSYTAALKTAEKQYTDLANTLNNSKQVKLFTGAAADFSKAMRSMEDEAEKASMAIRDSMSKALFDTTDTSKLTGAQKAMLDRYEKQWIATNNKVVSDNKRTQDQLKADTLATQNSLTNQKIKEYDEAYNTAVAYNNKLNTKLKADTLATQNSLTNQKIKEYDEAYNAAIAYNNKLNASAKAQAKRISDIAIKSKKATYDRILKIKHLTDRKEIASEYIKMRKMSHAQLREYEKIQAKMAATTTTAKSPWGNIESVAHAVKTTALYGAVAQALFGIQTAMGAVIGEYARFDDSQKQMQAVLQATTEESLSAAKAIVTLGNRFGTDFTDVQEGMITLGRAGIDQISVLEDATEGLAALAILTGDTMGDGAAAMASMISVYPDLINGMKTYTETLWGVEIAHVGYIDKLGAIANATRLGLKDFSTINNYALTTATSIGLTSDAYLQLLGAMSKVGLNASTIGTSMRRLSKFTQDGADAVQRFFNVIGKSQKDFASDLKKDSTQELLNFTTQLKNMSDGQFSNAIKDLNIQMKATAVTMREIGKGNWLAEMIYQTETAKDVLAQADIAAEGLGITWARMTNIIKSAGNQAFASVTIEIKKVVDMLNINSEEAFVSLGQTIENFAVFAIKAIAGITATMAIFLNSIYLGVGGLAKLVGVSAQALSTLAPDTEDLAEASAEVVKYTNALADARDKTKGPISLLGIRQAKGDLKDAREELTRLNEFAAKGNYLKELGEDSRKWGDEATASAVKTQEGIEALFDAANKGATNYKDNMAKAKKESEELAKTLREGDTSSYTQGGIPPDTSAKMDRLKAESINLQKVLDGTMTYKAAQLAKITGEIEAQVLATNKLTKAAEDDVFSAKAQEDAARGVNDLLELRFRKQQMIRKEEETSATASGGAADKRAALKLITDDMDLARLSFDLAIAKADVEREQLGLLYTRSELNAISAQESFDELEFQKEALKVMIKRAGTQKNEATVLKKIRAQEIKVEKARLKAIKDAKKEAIEFANSMAGAADGFADGLLNGDIAGAFESLIDEIIDIFVDPLKDAFSTLFGNTMQDLVGGFYDSMTKSVTEFAAQSVGETGKVGQANALTGVAGQAQGDPYTAFARMAAMAAAMAALGFAVGGMGSGGGVSEADIEASKGRTDYDDESLTNLADMFEDAQYPMLEVTNKMYKSIRSMDENFFAIARAFSSQASQGGIDLTGANFVDVETSGFLGFSSTSVELIGTGLLFAAQSLGDMMELSVNEVLSYTTTLESKSKAWGLSTSEKIREAYATLPQPVIDDLADNFASAYGLLLTAGVELGFDEQLLSQQLSAAEIDLGKIDFTGLSPDEVNQRLTDAFSTAFSGVAEQIPVFTNLIDKYTKGTEQALETLGRLAVEFNQASYSFGLIGKDFATVDNRTLQTSLESIPIVGSMFIDTYEEAAKALTDSGFAVNYENLMLVWGTTVSGVIGYTTETVNRLVGDVYTAQEQILDIVASTGGLNEFQDAMSSFISGFYSEEEQAAYLRNSIETAFATMGLTDFGYVVPQTNDEFRTLLETMDTTTEEGAYLYGQVLLLSEGFATMNDAAQVLLTTLTDTALFTEFVGSSTDFTARKIALTGDEEAMAEFGITAAEMMLDAIVAQTELYDITMENYEDELAAAHLVGELTADQLANWELLGDAIMNVEEAIVEFDNVLETLLTTLTDAALATQYLSGTQSFDSRTLALSGADDITMAASAITAAEEMLKAIELETELSGLTIDNYLEQLEIAHLAGQLTSDQLASWESLGNALLNVEESTKTYTDLVLAEEERLADERLKILEDAAAEALKLQEAAAAAIEGIADAWLGNLSYLTLAQKAEYASAYLSIAKDSDGTIDTVDAAKAAAEIAIASTATKEEYIPAFERYIIELENQIPEKTLDDVVEKLDNLIDEVVVLQDKTTDGAIYA